MIEIDPMIEDLIAAVTTEHSFPRTDHAGRDKYHQKHAAIAEQLSERLTRPSREEVRAAAEELAKVAARFSPKAFAVTYRIDTLLDLVCGPEPAPKGKRVIGERFNACYNAPADSPRHAICEGIFQRGDDALYCTCECHQSDYKETIDV